MYLQCITDDYYKVLPVFNVLHHVFQRCDCMLAPKEEVALFDTRPINPRHLQVKKFSWSHLR